MLSEVQKRVFCGVCCQQKGFGAVAVELNLGREQAEAIFCKGLELVFSEYQKAEGEVMRLGKLK